MKKIARQPSASIRTPSPGASPHAADAAVNSAKPSLIASSVKREAVTWTR